MSLVYRKTLNFLKGKNEDDKDIKININGENKRTCNNSVITSKYTVFNFIFLNMYEQFHKISNVYFFFIGILQVIPQFTATNGIPTVFFPLLIVLTANAIKDAFEDWNRHKTDKIENNRMCYVIVNEEEKNIYEEKSNKKNIFKKLKRYIFGNRKICSTENYYDEDDMYDDEITDINDYINNYEENLENIEDILLLCTSHKNGIAFVETSSLDGETNLKVKEANAFLFNILGNDRNIAIDKVKNLKGFILSDKPNKDLSTMYGTIYFEKDKKIDVENIGIQELLKKTTEEIEYRKKRLSSVRFK
ncbi:aminophospholipid-transporting P-ATPase, putative [Plasmodium sp. gorilla clade G2]|uniref:aminophospholipid-transporting P-ATPase, putative n=1 Tax=Plasmodium sp. gorilla clade G2 TaxID=880535 RepID=UPI000D21F285|nr:aminophospholipid-transporting P-ATPase, putative [Plasmodium sp. gorilla clade G2]SOV16834.1 aminophospholipid-transporting P-ATPase, putative [Plasmodium sp. gorilla clade G2]